MTRPLRHSVGFSLLIFLVAAAPALAQPADSTALVRLELNDGTVLVGTIVAEDSVRVVMRTVGGAEVVAPAREIRRRSAYAGAIRNGRLVRVDPNRTRLMFGPTARSLQRGHGYLAVYELVLPFVAYGPGAGVSLSGGTVFAPGAFLDVFYAAPKFTLYERASGAVAVGAFAVAVTEEVTICDDTGCTDDDDVVWGALPFVVGTFGGSQRAMTVGAALPVGDGGPEGSFVVMIGGEAQVSNSIKLLTESYLLLSDADPDLLLGVGVRFFGERLAADVGAFLAPGTLGDTDVIPFVPWLGFSYSFGN